ncbi:hypothetical protein HDU79_002580 [Rhizoclosmatium sp. JEL0117]|nr:hypothetical protein HDU79_002580 [Rhizoclosmatium sp. JEL0117]
MQFFSLILLAVAASALALPLPDITNKNVARDNEIQFPEHIGVHSLVRRDPIPLLRVKTQPTRVHDKREPSLMKPKVSPQTVGAERREPMARNPMMNVIARRGPSFNMRRSPIILRPPPNTVKVGK